jgi:hypothetical protein
VWNWTHPDRSVDRRADPVVVVGCATAAMLVGGRSLEQRQLLQLADRGASGRTERADAPEARELLVVLGQLERSAIVPAQNRPCGSQAPSFIRVPDGMTVDAAGDLWVAIYGGGRVHRYSPDGSLRQAILVPAAQTTCCGFGRPHLHRLYITTATENWSDEERRAEPAAGVVYSCDTNTVGVPATPFRPDPDW